MRWFHFFLGLPVMMVSDSAKAESFAAPQRQGSVSRGVGGG